MKRSFLKVSLAAFGVVTLLAWLALIVVFYVAHQPVLAIIALVMLAAAVWVYVSPRFYAWRYVIPGVLAVLVFIVLPMVYTLMIGFTNYSSAHLLPFRRATDVLLDRTISSDQNLAFTIHKLEGEAKYVFVFTDDADKRFASGPVTLDKAERVPLKAIEGETASDADIATPALTLKQIIAMESRIKALTAVMPDGSELRMSSMRRFSAMRSAYVQNADGTLTDNASGVKVTPDFAAGYWKNADGSKVEPGFRTYVGFANYVQIFTEKRFLEPFGRVFTWTMTFSILNTLLTFGIGVVLATALNWDALNYRNFYRMMLFLPYAVPAFISIPVFRGLFNENLGEINMVLDMLFGVRPGWFSDATLARSMVLIVNTWLGYPYMMIISMGLIKAIPGELYEASALAGAGPLTNFFRITLPLIARPIAPLLISSFAFNFNNLTLIALLTNGMPDFLDTEVPVGATDLLASYTYRIAFQDSGQNYALACAISSIVFLIVATLAVLNLRLFKVNNATR